MTHPTTFMPLAAGYAPLMGHHRHLLDDRVRTTALLEAVAKTVKRGDIVCDLGTGTGILAIAARRAGAAAVYAIERERMIGLAASIARDNGVNGITWIAAHSRDVELPERVDVIVSEPFGVLGIGGTMMEEVCALRDRSLRTGGHVVPGRVTIFAAPVNSPRDHAFVDAWSKKRYGLDLRAATALAHNQPYNTRFASTQLLAKGVALAAVDLEHDAYRGALTGTATFTVRAGTMHGFAAWFVSDLGGGVSLTTAPGKPDTIWRQVYFPIAPLRVRKSERIQLDLAYAHGHFAWRGTVGTRAFSHDTRASVPREL